MTEENNMDLERVRDDRCIPVARAILSDMASDLIPLDANEKIDYNPVVLKMLQRAYDADLNIQIENSYVLQLILGLLSGLNMVVQKCNILPIDEVRYGNIARQILHIISEANLPMGNSTPEKTLEDFAGVKEKINSIFAEEKLTLLELKYVMDNIFDSFKTVTSLFNVNIERSSEKAEAKLFKVEAMSDVTMKKLDDVLKAE